MESAPTSGPCPVRTILLSIGDGARRSAPREQRSGVVLVGVHSLGYVRLGSPRLAKWQELASEVLGLMQVEGETPDALHYRIDDYPPRLVISPAEAPRMEAMGFEVRDRREFEAVISAIEKEGISVTTGLEKEAVERRVTGLARFVDPGDSTVELFYGPILDHVPFHTPIGTRFITGDMGMGHVVISSPDFAASCDFYMRVLGFYERNTMSTPMGEMIFLSPNRRHHSLGIIGMDGPPQMIHFMLEVTGLDDVGRALDRVEQRGLTLMFTLGRHTNDHTVSFYVYTPDGSAVEYGFGGIDVPEPAPTYAITQTSIWGHHFNPPPALD